MRTGQYKIRKMNSMGIIADSWARIKIAANQPASKNLISSRIVIAF
jgi:hypothetical protein